MNDFSTGQRFDRVVSVEMFEHMSNWRALLTRVRGWLKPDGLLFLHVFTHKRTPYRFEVDDPADWIAQYFFTGGVMPSHDLARQFPTCSRSSRTGAGTASTMPAPPPVAGQFRRQPRADRSDPGRGLRPTRHRLAPRWRLFFLATSGLFGHRGGEEWGVSHYRLRPVQEAN
jgi:cyclopropane-fatty-acyl-phospholipid synthase